MDEEAFKILSNLHNVAKKAEPEFGESYVWLRLLSYAIYIKFY